MAYVDIRITFSGKTPQCGLSHKILYSEIWDLHSVRYQGKLHTKTRPTYFITSLADYWPYTLYN